MPKAAISETKTATENLVKLFKKADDILSNRLDLDIELFKDSSPEFYSQYKSSRIINSTSGGSKKVVGNVKQAGSGQPMKGVIFTFLTVNNTLTRAAGDDTAKPLIKKSAQKGKFRVTLPENTYRVIVEKIGFKTQEVTITVTSGETTNLNIEMEKE